MIGENTIHSHTKAVTDIYRMLNAIETRQRWEKRANDMTLKTSKQYKAVDRGGYYQIWLVQTPNTTP